MARKIDEAIETSGISKLEIAEKLGVSRPTLDAYIKGVSVINSDKLLRLSEITGRSVDYFFQEEGETKIFFRATHIDKIPKKYQVEAEEALRKYSQLEKLLKNPPTYISLVMPLNRYEEEEIKKIANTARGSLGLSPEIMIPDVFEIVGRFAKIIRFEMDEEEIFGFSSYSDSWGAAIFLNKKNTLERQIFTLVHEFGHLIMHRDYYKKDMDQKEYKMMEKMANYFSGVFLVPNELLEETLEDFGKKITWESFLKVKSKLRVSAMALLYRFMQQGIISREKYVKVNNDLKKNYKKDEPGPKLLEKDFYSLKNDKFKNLLKISFFEKHLSPSKLSELARVSQKEVREWIRSWMAEKDLEVGASER